MQTLKTNGMLTILAAAFMAGACSEMRSPTKPAAAALATGQSTQASDASALAAVRQATAAFHEADKAIAAGYASPVGGHCDETAAGAMGVHSVNPALMQTPALIPEQPEVLLYLPSGSGNYRLVGVEYVQTLLLRNTQTGQVAPGSRLDRGPPGTLSSIPRRHSSGKASKVRCRGTCRECLGTMTCTYGPGHPIRAVCSRNGTRRSAAIRRVPKQRRLARHRRAAIGMEWNMLRHLGLIAVCACIIASVGCDGGKLTAPAPPPADRYAVRSEYDGHGRIQRQCGQRRRGRPRRERGGIARCVVIPRITRSGLLRTDMGFPKNTATSGADGTFTLPLNLPSCWRLCPLTWRDRQDMTIRSSGSSRRPPQIVRRSGCIQRS